MSPVIQYGRHGGHLEIGFHRFRDECLPVSVRFLVNGLWSTQGGLLSLWWRHRSSNIVAILKMFFIDFGTNAFASICLQSVLGENGYLGFDICGVLQKWFQLFSWCTGRYIRRLFLGHYGWRYKMGRRCSPDRPLTFQYFWISFLVISADEQRWLFVVLASH